MNAALISALVQLGITVLMQILQQREEDKKKKAELHEEATKAVKSRDISGINLVLDKLRAK